MLVGTAVCALLVLASGSLATADIVNVDVSRNINLQSYLCTVVTSITAKNTGNSAVSSYALAAESGTVGTLAHTAAESNGRTLDVTEEGVVVTLKAGSTTSFTVTQTYTHCQTPYPAEITQKEGHKVVFEGSAVFSSPYVTEKQKTVVVTSDKVESYTKFKPAKQSGTKITYGPYENVAAGSIETVKVHFDTKATFLTTSRYVREVMVSHWGHASIKEDISVYHSGAKHVGEFSRLDFTRLPEASQTAIKQWTTALHPAAEDVYYRDVVGNISTSHLRVTRDEVVLEIEPRFPLMGGWKTEYTIGYTLPSGEILDSDGSSFKMTTLFLGHIYDNQAVDEAEVRVVLPEGASNIVVDTPFSVDSQEEDVLVTYFDTVGRPVVILRKNNLVEAHMQEFSVSYTMPPMSTYREPLMAVGFFTVLFFAAIVLNRVDLSIKVSKQD